MNRSHVIGSAVIHSGIVAGLLVARASQPIVVPGPDVVQVALLDPSATLPVMAQPPAPTPKREPEVTPTDEEGIKLDKPKPKKEPDKTPVPDKPEPPRATPALPYAAVGPQGLRGAVSVDAADFEFTYYLMLVRNRIAQNWTSPGSGQGLRAVVFFRIARGGGVLQPRVEETSGVEYFDRAALRAVQVSDPLPPLPLGWPGSDLGVHFGFEYTGS